MTASNAAVPLAGSTYDETPYPSSSFPQTHPDKLCAMARLFGLDAPDPSSARVLELGCADGANLLPMAQHAPNATFVGIDASAKQVAAAHAAIAATQLGNVEVRHGDILEFSAGTEKFDYIIVHGIFSWVPDAVRDKILTIARDHLADNGVAYVSYNAFPGWGMRMALRDMILFHTGSFADPKMKVQQARALTAFLAESVAVENNPYGMLLKQELERMKGYDDGYMRHDILEEINQPFYFHQFIERSGRAGLQYLGETSLDQMLASNFPEKVAQTLEKVDASIVAKEQYMDFVRNRNFRQTLLCRQGVQLSRNLSPNSIRDFYYTSMFARPEPGTLDLSMGVRHSFKLRTGGSAHVAADDPFVKAMFATLAEHGLKRISFDEIRATAHDLAAPFVDPALAAERELKEEATVLQNLFPLYIRGIVDIFSARPALSGKIPARPQATALMRYEALNRRQVTNRAHQPVALDAFARYVLAECDGDHDVNAILDALVKRAGRGELTVAENNQPVTDERRVRMLMGEKLKMVLPSIVSLGFFVEQ